MSIQDEDNIKELLDVLKEYIDVYRNYNSKGAKKITNRYGL